MLPNLGKYHMTACTKCYKIVDPEIAKENRMKCSCGGRIKKGVDYRIYEISDYSKPCHPSHRPPYIHLMPLAEVIGTVYDKGVTTKTVQSIWQRLIDKFAVEIEVLINAPLEEIAEVDERVVVEVANTVRFPLVGNCLKLRMKKSSPQAWMTFFSIKSEIGYLMSIL